MSHLTPFESQNAIEVRSLEMSFSRKKVLNGLSFKVPQNSITGFLGANGSGKTTTLRLLLGLLPISHSLLSPLPGYNFFKKHYPNKNKVIKKNYVAIHGELMPYNHSKVMKEIGAVVENPSFLEHFTAFENLKWFGSLYKPLTNNRIEECIELVGLKEALKQPFGTFSSGMKQRLGVAFGILHNPALLILDEPTSGMDPAGRVQMREILRQVHALHKTTIFMSSHLLDEVQKLCDYVVIINKGKAVSEGYVKDLLTDSYEEWELRVKDSQFQEASKILDTLLPAGASYTRGPTGFKLKISVGESAMVNRGLVDAGIDVLAIIPSERSLEDAYMKLTSEDKSI